MRVRTLCRAGMLVVAAAALVLSACDLQSSVTCVAENAAATVQVQGTFRYSGAPGASLRGQITFVQEGNLVAVTRVVYLNSTDRALVGQAELSGNRLDIVLVPENGDTDYTANVTFIFSEDGDSFCVEFSDTNGDTGELGSYVGVRIAS